MSILLGAIEPKNYIDSSLHKFLSTLKEDDFKGSKTKVSIRNKAKKFLEKGNYQYGEAFRINGEKYDVHNSLLALIYDEI